MVEVCLNANYQSCFVENLWKTVLTGTGGYQDQALPLNAKILGVTNEQVGTNEQPMFIRLKVQTKDTEPLYSVFPLLVDTTFDLSDEVNTIKVSNQNIVGDISSYYRPTFSELVNFFPNIDPVSYTHLTLPTIYSV